MNTKEILGRGEIFRYDRKREAIQCRTGSVWITFSGELDDFLLVPGKAFTLRGKKKICIQALEDAILEYL